VPPIDWSDDDMTDDRPFDAGRDFLKDHVRKRVDFSATGQARGLAPPPLHKPVPDGAVLVDLPDGETSLRALGDMALGAAILKRESVRRYAEADLTLDGLSALLWASQGVRAILHPATALRTVPSAGARHAFETYLAVMRVDGLTPGLYRFLPFHGKLLALSEDPPIGLKTAACALGQRFVAAAAVTFLWTAVPARMEWRYAEAAHKVIAIDAGHVGQNLYLAAEAIGAGCCTIAAYDQDACDRLLGVDGSEEFTVYLAPVGKRVEGA